MRHFLHYWRTYDPSKELGTSLDFAASGQFGKTEARRHALDCCLEAAAVDIVGKAGRRQSRQQAKGDQEARGRVYDAPLVALAKLGTEQDIIEVDVQAAASQLRFESSHDRLSLTDSQRTNGKQLQMLRELTPKTASLLQTALKSHGGTRTPTNAESHSRRVLFARVGWMTHYSGPQTGDEKPIGGGENNKKNIGHEVFNFADFGGRLYGFVRAQN